MSQNNLKHSSIDLLQPPDNVLEDVAKQHVHSNVTDYHSAAYDLDFSTGKKSVINADILHDKNACFSNISAQGQKKLSATQGPRMAQSGVSHRVCFMSSESASGSLKRKSLSTNMMDSSKNRGIVFRSANTNKSTGSVKFFTVQQESVTMSSAVRYPSPLVSSFDRALLTPLKTTCTDESGPSTVPPQISFPQGYAHTPADENASLHYNDSDDFMLPDESGHSTVPPQISFPQADAHTRGDENAGLHYDETEIFILTATEYIDIGDCDQLCHECQALFWLDERVKGSFKDGQIHYHRCCSAGKVVLPRADYVKGLFANKRFMESIRAYNQMFSMTSFGADIDNPINRQGPYVFKISGQIYHWIGALCPEDGHAPRFLHIR